MKKEAKKFKKLFEIGALFSNSIDANQNEKADIPMNIFISYGHPEEEICLELCKYLEKRGHSVWFDRNKINHGDDWRESIIAGLENSNGVIACLSKHSTRSPGVCLDELTIAVGIKGNVIKTILLDDEKNVIPPATLSNIQWLDMHDWRVRSHGSKRAYKKWCEENFYKVAQVIESKENINFVGNIALIKQRLGVYINFDRQKYYLSKPFYGRKWLAAEVENWLINAPEKQICVLYGDPGIGKSAFAAHYSHYNARVVASFFCRANEINYNNPTYVFKSLAYLFACRMPDYRRLLLERITHTNFEEFNEYELFRFLLEEPLSIAIDGNRDSMCVLIDGLDECGTTEQNTLADILGKYVKLLPKWIRFLIISRKTSGVLAPLHDFFKIELKAHDSKNLEDVAYSFQNYLKNNQISCENYDTLLQVFQKKSCGIFLYADLLMDGIKKNAITVDDIENFPEGLFAILHEWFSWVFPDIREYREIYRLVLGAIYASPEPLPVDELKRIFLWGDNEYQDFYSKASILLQQGIDMLGNETVTLSHEYLSEWLNSSQNLLYHSYKKDALKYMYQNFLTRFTENIEKMSDYELRYMIPFYWASCDSIESIGDLLSKNHFKEAFDFRDLDPIVKSHKFVLRLLDLLSRTRMQTIEIFRDPMSYYGIDDVDLCGGLIIYRAEQNIYPQLDELEKLDCEMDRIISANEKYILYLKSELEEA